MKVLLIIYLASIAYFFIGFILLCANIVCRAKEEQLKVKKNNVAETIRTWLRIFILSIIPVFNLIIGTIFLFSRDLENRILEDMRKESI